MVPRSHLTWLLPVLLCAGPARAAAPRALVLGMAPAVVPRLGPASVAALDHHLLAGLRASGEHEVIPEAEVKAALLDAAKGRYRSCTDRACRSELAKKLGASRLFSATLTRAGAQCLLSLASVDAAGADPRQSSGRTACTEEALAGAIKSGLEKLLGKPLGELPFRPPSPRFRNEKDGLEMILVPAGHALLGATGGRDGEQPVRSQAVPAFYIDATPVSSGQYRRCVAAGACTAPATWRSCRYDHSIARRPVNCLGWEQAAAYCRWAGERLPSEVEWEKAARGPDGKLLQVGDGPNRYGFRVGVDGHGALEWTGDCEPQPACRRPDAGKTLSAQEQRRVVRGLRDRRLSFRIDLGASSRTLDIGFRCARSLTP